MGQKEVDKAKAQEAKLEQKTKDAKQDAKVAKKTAQIAKKKAEKANDDEKKKKLDAKAAKKTAKQKKAKVDGKKKAAGAKFIEVYHQEDVDELQQDVKGEEKAKKEISKHVAKKGVADAKKKEAQ